MKREQKTSPQISGILQHGIALIIFVVLSCIYFSPQFSGKQIVQSDLQQFEGMSREAVEYYEETGIQTLWTNAMFSGMPTYQITAWPDANKIAWLENAFNGFIPRPAGYFIFAQLAFYIMLILLGVNRWVAIPMAIAFAFTTNNFQLYEAGHTSKLRTLFSAPLIIAGLILTYRNKYLVGGAIFCAGLTMNIFTNHIQITYYMALCLGVLAIIEFVRSVKAKSISDFGKATGVLAIGSIMALASSGHNIYSTYEYSNATMRGKPTLTHTEVDAISSSQSDGLAWEYAMQWSNGLQDILATVVPRAAGGSSAERVPADSEWSMAFKRMGVEEAPLYWGPLPFTSGPAYYGATVLLLFVLGILIVRGYIKWWILGVVILTTLLSMGKHFPTLSKLFFDIVPLYNKFRAPSSILTITALFIPILAALGISSFLKSDINTKSLASKLYISYGIVGGLSLLLALLGTSFFDFSSALDARFQNEQVVDILRSDRRTLFTADAWRSFLFTTAIAGVLFSFLKGWIQKNWLIATLIGVLIILDLWTIDRRYIAPSDFIPQRQIESAFTPDAADQQILRDTDPHYRVHDLTVQSFQNSHRAYFHHMIGGYHAAKLQRYQDIIDKYLSQGKESVFNMLNARYFIVPGEDGNPIVQRNPQALGNAWFVDEIVWVDSADDEINAVGEINPQNQAVIHREFENEMAGFDPLVEGSIELTEYAPNKLIYRSNTTSDQLAVFSEVWYGPNKGWHAYIDGAPAKLVRSNYLLRAMKVPAGEHEIVMEFKPQRYGLLKTIATISSVLVLALVLFVVYHWWSQKSILLRESSVEITDKPGKGKSKKKNRD